jgi:hypothetical protein
MPTGRASRICNALSVIQALLVMGDQIDQSLDEGHTVTEALCSVDADNLLTVGEQAIHVIRWGAEAAECVTGIQLAGFRASCRLLSSFVGAAGSALGAASAVYSVCAGFAHFCEGLAADRLDIPRVADGLLEMGVGTLLLIGAVTGNPFVLLGAVALDLLSPYIVQLVARLTERPIADRTLYAICRALLPEDDAENKPAVCYVVGTLDLQREVQAVLDQIPHWHIWDTGQAATFNRDPSEEHDLMQSLRKLGLRDVATGIFRGHQHVERIQQERPGEMTMAGGRR